MTEDQETAPKRNESTAYRCQLAVIRGKGQLGIASLAGRIRCTDAVLDLVLALSADPSMSFRVRGELAKSGGPGGRATPDRPSGITREDYLRIYPKLAAKIWQFGIRGHQVEDLVQDTFRQAYEGLLAKRFDSRSALDTWVISIGKNVCLKHHRAQNAEKRKAIEVPIAGQTGEPQAQELPLRSDLPSPERQAEDRELLSQVLGLIRVLPTILREPLVLKARGHSYGQIARLLAIPQELVSSRIHQARAELRRKLPGAQSPPAR